MKRLLSLGLIIVLVLSLAACGKKELTSDNIKDYLSFSSTVDCDVETDEGFVTIDVYPISYKIYSGEATADIKITNQTGAKFENAKLELKLKIITCEANEDGLICGWEFKKGGHKEGSNRGNYLSYKTITVDLPYDGNWNTSEIIELVLYSKWKDLSSAPMELSNVSIEVVSATGSIVE